MAYASQPGSSLTILGGPLDGRSFPLGTAFEELLVGSDADCHVHIELPGVSPVHANLLVEGAGVTVRDTRSPFGLYVNDDPVTEPVALRDGDVLWLGPPGEPQSVMLLCRVVVQVPTIPPAPGVPSAAPPEDDLLLLDAHAAPASAAPEADGLFMLDEPVPSAPAEAQAPAPDDDVFFVGTPAPFDPPAAVSVDRPAPAPASRDEDVFFSDDDDAATLPPQPAPKPSPEPVVVAAAAPTATVAASPPRAPSEVRLGDEDAFALRTPTSLKPLEAPPEFFVEDVEGDEAPLAPAPPAAVSQEANPIDGLSLSEAPLAIVHDEDFSAADEAIPETIRLQAPPAAPPPASPSAPVAAATVAMPSPVVAKPNSTPQPKLGDGVPEEFTLTTPAPSAARAAAPAPAAVRPAPATRRPPSSASPAAPPTPRPRPPVRRPTAAAPARARRVGGGRTLGLIVGALVLVAAMAGAAWYFLTTPRLSALQPTRAHPGQVVVVHGAHFSGASQVLFDNQAGRVLKAEATRLEVEVPELTLQPGADARVAVTVTNAGRRSGTLMLAAYLAPRLHGIAPEVALPGEDVELAGTGWTSGAVVRFGTQSADVLSLSPTHIRVRVPALDGPPGTPAPVTVAMGEALSNAAPFFLGRLPLVTSVQPASASPGDVLTVSGRGFSVAAGGTRVRIGGRAALTLAGGPTALRIVVPFGVGEGAVPLEVQVAGIENVGQAVVNVPPAAGALVDFRFVAEPLEEAPDGSRAAVSTELGPAFMLAALGPRSAAQRAHELQQRLNAAAVPLKAALTADIELRLGTGSPALGVRGRPDVLIDVTSADALAYTEAGGRSVSPERLASWWTALGRDLVQLLVRSERPHLTADLAPEGRVLGDLFQSGRRTASFGLPRTLLDDPRTPRAALRALALRVPAAVPEPLAAGAAATTPASPGAPAPLKLRGIWAGNERVPEGRRFISVTFGDNTGIYALESGLNLSLPLLSVEQPQRGSVRFSLRLGGGVRYYNGRWDGERLSGRVSSDAAGREDLGSFELVPR
jgi:hypothetical protein